MGQTFTTRMFPKSFEFPNIHSPLYSSQDSRPCLEAEIEHRASISGKQFKVRSWRKDIFSLVRKGTGDEERKEEKE